MERIEYLSYSLSAFCFYSAAKAPQKKHQRPIVVQKPVKTVQLKKAMVMIVVLTLASLIKNYQSVRND
jgi:hypothetical protein